MARSRAKVGKVTDRDLGWKEILGQAVHLARGAYVKVGILGGDDEGGLHEEGADLTVAEIAVVNEFGTEDGRISARPAHRMTYDARRSEIERQSGKLLAAIVIDRKMTVEQALNLIGLSHATAIKKTITEGAGVPPPNAPSVVRRKMQAGEWNARGKAKRKAGWGVRTLVDTGRTINAISWATFLGTVELEHRYLTGRGGR